MINEDAIFYLCTIIECIGRKTKNTRKDVVDALGDVLIKKIYDLADVYHCENIDKVTHEFIVASGLTHGTFDNVGDCDYEVPTLRGISRVFGRLVYMIMDRREVGICEAVHLAFDNKVCDLISDFNGLFFCENPENIYITWDTGVIE